MILARLRVRKLNMSLREEIVNRLTDATDSYEMISELSDSAAQREQIVILTARINELNWVIATIDSINNEE